MSEWWTYRLSDFLMFSPRTYYRLFELYNRAFWPAQIAALLAGGALVVGLARPAPRRDGLAASLLAAAWAWVGFAFHLERYSAINWAARDFAVACFVQAALLGGFAVLRRSAVVEPPRDRPGRIGIALAGGAVCLMPLCGPLLGRDWRQAEVFGMAPDPTAVATLGALLVLRARAGWVLWIVPLLWCGVTGATLWTMGASDAWVTPLAAVLALGAAAARRWRARPSAARPASPAP